MIAGFLAVLEHVFAWLLAASWQAAVLALFILLIQGALGPRLNPRWRYALWLLVLARLVLPALPESAISLFQFAPHPPPSLVVSVTEPLFPPVTPPAPDAAPLPLPSTAPTLSFFSLLALVWLGGALTLFVLTWQANRRFARQIDAALSLDDPGLAQLFAAARAELGITRKIRLIVNERVRSPAIMGLFRPTLLLPADVREKFDARELRLIFLHELAHLKRGDVFVQALIAALQILHWFNPVLWLAFRRMRIDREPATDALVLSHAGESEKEGYGLMLLKMLEHFNQRHSLATLVGVLEDKDQFKRRFSLIARFTRGAYGWSLLGVVVLAILAIAGLTRGHRVVAPPSVIDLKPYYVTTFSADSTTPYANLAGRQMIDGLPFDIGGEIELYGLSQAQRNVSQPPSVTGIKIGRTFDELHLIHAWRWREYPGCPVAIVRLHYADGSQADFTLRDKFHIDDWNRLLTENDETVADPDTKIVWRGPGAVKGTGRLFKSVLRNPHPDRVVESMDVISTRSYMSYVLLAATVASHDPDRVVTAPMELYPSRNFDGTFNVHVVDRATGAPIAGAEVQTAWIVQDISLVGDYVLTGADGVATIKFPRSAATDLRIEITKSGYLNCDDNWNNGWDGPDVPPSMVYRLTPGQEASIEGARAF